MTIPELQLLDLYPSLERVGPPDVGLKHTGTGGIVVAPFTTNPVLHITWTVWRCIFRLLVSYDCPVSLIGDPGRRADYGAFEEHRILCDSPDDVKLQALADASMVIGVPNWATWACANWKEKKLIILYPETQPANRWFPWHSPSFGRIVYHPDKIQIPVMLCGVRELIRTL